MLVKPAVVGIGGRVLLEPERLLLRAHRPAGVILFARNIADPAQLRSLMADLRAALPEGALLMVDQEGGRVARLRPPFWRAHPPARALDSERAAWITGALIGIDCAAAGFNLVAAPVLDVADPAGHDVIGDRAFSGDPVRVAALGAAFAAGLIAAGVMPVGKHAPGHGRARVDSHLSLPELDDVSERDLLPFVQNSALPWLMTAHIRYSALDAANPATQSRVIIEQVIRGRIGFKGMLISDDLAMQALTGSPGERAARAIAAGCDVALHCSGILSETADVLAALSPVALRWSDPVAVDLDADALSAERDLLSA